MGRTEADRKITDEPWSSIERGTNKTTLRSEGRRALKKRLTEPTLLEMSGYQVNQACGVLPHSPSIGSNHLG
jgi:hypothetical protein